MLLGRFNGCGPAILLAWVACSALGAISRADDGAARGVHPSVGALRTIVLLRSPKVRAELNLAADQIKTIEEAIVAANHPLWSVRDFPAEKVDESVHQLADRFDEQVRGLLRPNQYERLEQIAMRLEGWPALCSPPAAQRLKLSTEQVRQIEAVLREHIERSGPNSGDLNASRQEQIVSLLTEPQRRQLTRLVGKPFDVGQVRQQIVPAPELREIGAWINSQPLRLSDLRGRVVALHFFTHGCINCIHNYPTYKTWHAELPADRFVLLGVHTPEGEGEGERDPSWIRAAMSKEGLEFPVAVDNQRRVWSDWGNHIWPAVYLIDKEGFVRYWWYGELKWQGAEGDRIMRERIEQMMAE